MTAFVALLRAVNVGGTSKLPMAELKAMGERCGFASVRTYIASGNLLFESDQTEPQVKAALEAALAAYAGRHIPILVRTAAEMAAAVAANPFSDRTPSRTGVLFLDGPPSPDTLAGVVAPGGEEVALGVREIYAYYGEGMGNSKLKIPGANSGTMRNMNTVAQLADLARA